MKLSIVIPVYNERERLEEAVVLAINRRLDQIDEREIVLVDDASSDGTAAVAAELVQRHSPLVRLFSHSTNQGKGAALRTGFAKVTGEIVIIQDADLEYDPQDYGRLIQPIIDGNADVVFGSRFMGSSEKRVLFFWHMIGNRLLTLFSNMLTNLNLTDMETGYKAFRRSVVDSVEIEENRFGVEPELTAKVASQGARIYEVGISYFGRSYAEGKKINWRDGVYAFWCILKYRLKGNRARRLTYSQASALRDTEGADTLHPI